MTRKSKDIDKTNSGRKRVRLNGARGSGKREQSREHMEKMWKARDESRASAPRHGRGKGFAGHNHRYKQLVAIHNNSSHPPGKRVTYDPDAESTSRNLPLFIKKPKVADKMIELLSRGIPPTTVCRYVGIRYDTFKRWLEVGALGTNPLYSEFLGKVAKAEAEAEIHLVEKIEVHQMDDWKSVAWMLERRFPENWARRDRHEVSGKIEVDSKEKLAEKVIEDPEALDLARKLLDDGTEVYTLPSDMIGDDGDGQV